MRKYTQENLMIRPEASVDPDLIVEVTPEKAGWEIIHFQARRLAAGKEWRFATGMNELALVVLGGTLDVDFEKGQWRGLGQRANVFAGKPTALYLPIQTEFAVRAQTDCEYAVTWAATDQQYEPHLITPADSAVEIRGGDHATRQINSIIPPGFPCARLVVVEVYTPGGNWSSYPPHKHDVHKTGPDGQIIEADLEEIYYYKIDRPEGYAIQRVYTGIDSPLQVAGAGIDALLMPRDNDVVLVPEGYHPVSCPPGYTAYYLNVLAGSAQSLTASDDPDFTWVKNSYKSRDPRVPIYDIS